MLTPSADVKVVLATLRVLIHISGPDWGASLLCKEGPLGLFALLGRLLLASLTWSEPSSQVTLCTLLVNVVDRSAEARSHFIKEEGGALDALQELIGGSAAGDSASSEAINFYTVTLGIILSDSHAARAVRLSGRDKVVQVHRAFVAMAAGLEERGVLSGEVKAQLDSFAALYRCT